MRTDLLDYELPERLIARRPLAERSAARMLVVGEELRHAGVRDLPALLEPGSLLVVNDTRVLPARLFGQKATGGRIELLLVRCVRAESREAEEWLALVKSGKPLRVGASIGIDERLTACVLAARNDEGLATVRLEAKGGGVDEAILRVGQMPLPPYLGREVEPADRERYQTVFARVAGAVAAPTAGLHFDRELVLAIEARGVEVASVTLHVGPGTFRPVGVDDLDRHPMHAEEFSIGAPTAGRIAAARARGGKVVAVGTTAVRSLESASDPERPGCVRAVERAETRLLIQPGYRFQVVDQLVTNFHLPRSTLLALVYAFGSRSRVRSAYEAAIAEEYRFYSYGDAMFLPCRDARDGRSEPG